MRACFQTLVPDPDPGGKTMQILAILFHKILCDKNQFRSPMGKRRDKALRDETYLRGLTHLVIHLGVEVGVALDLAATAHIAVVQLVVPILQ